MSLYEMIAVVWRRRWLFVSIVVAAALIGVAWALLMTPIYRGQVVMIPAPDDAASEALAGLSSQIGGLAALAGVNLPMGGTSKDESLATLRSQEFTERFIIDEGLMPILFDRKWDARSGHWKPDVKEPTVGDAFRLFDEHVRSVSEDRRSGIVTLTVDWKDRELAAAWANRLVESLNRQMREKAIAETRRSVEYLNREFAASEYVELQQMIARLKESQIKRIMLASVRDEYAFRVIDPARPSDPDKRVRPFRTLMVSASVVFGALFALLVVALLELWPRRQVKVVVNQ